MHWLDWLIVFTFFALTLAIGLHFTRRAGESLQSFFVSSRLMPWYLVGVSMVATNFASDTPLWVTSLVRRFGLYYMWQYWTVAIGICLGTVLFSRLWARMNVLTDIELIEQRYSGRCAGALRFWSGFIGAVIICPLMIGWVIKAMEMIAREAIGVPPEYRIYTTIGVVGIALLSVSLSGLWGVIYTDFIQFGLAMVGSIALAGIAVAKVGGIRALTASLSANSGWQGHDLSFSPSIGWGPGEMSIWNIIGYFGLIWIGVALSGSWLAQRLLSCKDSRNASFSMLTFAIGYLGIICWPWIITALCSIVLYPTLTGGVTHDSIYPKMAVDLLPMGLRGLLVVAMLSAFMSTISTLFNWGSSYLVNDMYKRFAVRGKPGRHYVTMGRIFTVAIAIAGAAVSFQGDSIQSLLEICWVFNACTGGVIVLRWFWWRMTAVGELVSSLSSISFAIIMLFTNVFNGPFTLLTGIDRNLSSDISLLGARMLFALIFGTVVAVVASLLSRPTEMDKLVKFVSRARPFPYLWMPVIRRAGGGYKQMETLPRTLVSWVLALVCVYSLCFGIGKLLLGNISFGVGLLAVFVVTLWMMVRRINDDSIKHPALVSDESDNAQSPPDDTPPAGSSLASQDSAIW